MATAPAGAITIAGFYPSELSSEREFFAALKDLGIRTTYDAIKRNLYIERVSPAADEIEIDAQNIPTVVPTLAAVAPFINAGTTMRNAAHVNNHKCRRLDVMIHELARMGCTISPTHDRQGRVDGFTTRGRQTPTGGVALHSHGDHRIFLSLATAALGATAPSPIDGADQLHASFPDFLSTLEALGAGVDAGQLDPGVAR